MRTVLTSFQMRELDRQAIEDCGIPGRVLMETAGRGVATYCHEGLDERGSVVVACGGGNNGGDGCVAARALRALGHEVRVFLFADAGRLRGDAADAFASLQALGDVAVSAVEDSRGMLSFAQACERADLVVDALLGTGLVDDVRGPTAECIDVINDAGVPVVAVDIPSGVDADTGRVCGRAVRADATVTFAWPKRGHFLFPGAALRGDLHVVDIGIPVRLLEPLGVSTRVVDATDGPGLIRRRDRAAHKGNFGHVVVLAGSPETPGAAVLAAHGALRAGAGLVSWAADEATLEHAPGVTPEIMLRRRASGDANAWVNEILSRATAVVIGPGYFMSEERAEIFTTLIARAVVPLCLDAEALGFLAANPSVWERIRAPVVVTPHPKEMARLTGMSVESVQRDRVAAAIQLAAARGCVVVLKGAATVVADAGGAATLIDAGNPGLAKGGTGDVLAGVIGAFLAQGLEPSTAAQLGALLHGVAADDAVKVHGEAGLRATDVVDAMGGVWARWQR